jgi:hypothetical protein
MLVALLVLGILTAFVTVPIDTHSLPAAPRPAVDYASAVTTLDTMRVHDSALVMPDGASPRSCTAVARRAR